MCILLRGEEIKREVRNAGIFLRLFSDCNNFVLTESHSKATGWIQEVILFQASSPDNQNSWICITEAPKPLKCPAFKFDCESWLVPRY